MRPTPRERNSSMIPSSKTAFWRWLGRIGHKRPRLRRRRTSPGAYFEMLEPRLLLSFSAPQAFPIAGGAFAVAAGDFNGDHKVDLIAPAGLGGASVVLGNGDGTFSPPKNSFTTPVAGGIANGVAVGDFNRDGKLDAAVTNSSGYLSVLLGNGDGTFRAPSSTFVAPGLSSVAVGDFN